MPENLSPGFANNKGANQPVDPHLLFAYCTQYLIDLYIPYDVIYVNKHSVQCIVGLFGGDAPPLLLTIEACNH